MEVLGEPVPNGSTLPVGTTLSLLATPTCGDGPASAWQWTANLPDGTDAPFVPSAKVQNPTLTLTAEGEYAIAVEFWDPIGAKSCGAGLLNFWVGEGP
jgi:hypothetical protein